MQPIINLEEHPGKVVGRRRVARDSLVVAGAQCAADARAWKQALGTLRIKKGVYRFRTHEEADAWLWKMLTSSRG